MAKPSLSVIIGKVEDAETAAEEATVEVAPKGKDEKLEEVTETLHKVISELDEMIADED